MNEEKLVAVAGKLEVNPSIIKTAKRNEFVKKITYAWSQIFLFILSIVTLRYSWSIFSSENQWIRPTYPFDYLGDSLYVLMNPFFWILQIGNFSGSFFLRKKLGLKTSTVIAISFVNFVLVIVGFTAFHLLVSIPSSALNPSVLYGVHSRTQRKLVERVLNWE